MWHSIKFTHTFQGIDQIGLAIDVFQKRYKLPVTELRCSKEDQGYLESALRFLNLDIPIHPVMNTVYDEFSTVWVGNNA